MKKIVITEAQLEKLIENNKSLDMEEGIFDPIKNVYSGVKGLYKGYSYEFFKYSSMLKNVLRDLDRINNNIESDYLSKLNNIKIKLSKTDFAHKDIIEKEIYEIEGIISNYEQGIKNGYNVMKNRLR